MQKTSNIDALCDDGDSNAQQNEPGSEDNRSEIRVVSGERLFVQITQSTEKDLMSKTMACKAVDASAHGIKFLAKDFTPVVACLTCGLTTYRAAENTSFKMLCAGPGMQTRILR